MRSQVDRNSAELLAAIRAVFAAAPWAALEIMFVLTPEQWQALLSGEALVSLREAVKQRSLPALMAYRLSPHQYGEDITQEVLLKLMEGRFLKCYDPGIGHPRAYLMGASYQYARTLARSFWRGDGASLQFKE
jgi:hypothetical protein